MMKRAGNWLQRSVRRHQQLRSFSSALPAHRDTPDNTADTPFSFTAENMKKIEQIISKYPPNYKQSATIPLLYVAQEQNDNWLPLAAMNEIARILDINPMRVYEVATFYTMFNREKVGKFHLQVCGTTPCLVRGADKVIKALEDHLGVLEGHGMTKDGLFTITEVECLAACANAPMLQLNNEAVYEDLTPENVVELCEKLKNGTAKVGPQTDRNQAEGPMGRTNLKDPASIQNVCRDFAQLKKDLEAEAAKKAQA